MVDKEDLYGGDLLRAAERINNKIQAIKEFGDDLDEDVFDIYVDLLKAKAIQDTIIDEPYKDEYAYELYLEWLDTGLEQVLMHVPTYNEARYLTAKSNSELDGNKKSSLVKYKYRKVHQK